MSRVRKGGQSLAVPSQQSTSHPDFEGTQDWCFLEGNGAGAFNFPTSCVLVMQYFRVGLKVWECNHHISPHCWTINYCCFTWNAEMPLLVKGHSSYSCKALGLKTESEILWVSFSVSQHLQHLHHLVQVQVWLFEITEDVGFLLKTRLFWSI